MINFINPIVSAIIKMAVKECPMCPGKMIMTANGGPGAQIKVWKCQKCGYFEPLP